MDVETLEPTLPERCQHDWHNVPGDGASQRCTLCGSHRRKPWLFGKGNKAAKGGGQAREAAGPEQERGLDSAADVPVLQSGSQLYDDMRHVYDNQASTCATEGQKKCWTWYKKDRKGFMTKLAELEKAVLAKAQPASQDPGPEEPAVADEGTERVMDLIMQQLGEEWGLIERFEAAEKALGKEGLSRLLAEATVERRDERPPR